MNYQESLTPREQEVLVFVAQGLENQQIADALFIEKSTVRTHLNHIYAKVGISSRVLLALAAKDLISADQVLALRCVR